jgi:hypothetical protein
MLALPDHSLRPMTSDDDYDDDDNNNNNNNNNNNVFLLQYFQFALTKPCCWYSRTSVSVTDRGESGRGRDVAL